MKFYITNFFPIVLIAIIILGCEKDELSIQIEECVKQFTFPFDSYDGEHYVRSKIGEDSLFMVVSENNDRIIYNEAFTKYTTYSPFLTITDSTYITGHSYHLSIRNPNFSNHDAIFFIEAEGFMNSDTLMDHFFEVYFNGTTELKLIGKDSLGSFNLGIIIPCNQKIYNNGHQAQYNPVILETKDFLQRDSWFKITELELLYGKKNYDLYAITFKFQCNLNNVFPNDHQVKRELSGTFRTQMKVDK